MKNLERTEKTRQKPMDGILEEYLKQKSEESKTKPQKKQKTQRVAAPPPPSPSESSTAESLSEEDFSSDASSEAPPSLPVLRRTKNYNPPRRQNVQSVGLSFK